MGIETVGDLLAALKDHDSETPIRWAAQPGRPFEYTIGAVVQTPANTDRDGTPPTQEPVVWLGEGEQVGYLSDSAADALGWQR
ncbi:hypothetical protein [Saccharopolyspora phatthalungensis]|uniref:Uncharacterized protein n=1 Tax=Saccharopolyspora phatthalungensis TaxID=664693 RepID=A0A840QC87_9PSEU|nr:hypothetical protein [Saccharopolyspora phatthalungensis]MBB5157441.1 hypothetical protein [Saccharopolyspora phatthalungensis]